jgi:hypothetical protein
LALAAALLASGSFHFHRSGSSEREWAAAAGARTELRSATSHPRAPLHVESVELERAPRCLQCLLRHKDHVLSAPELALTGPLSASPATQTDVERTVLRRAGDPGQPRGPPLV